MNYLLSTKAPAHVAIYLFSFLFGPLFFGAPSQSAETIVLNGNGFQRSWFAAGIDGQSPQPPDGLRQKQALIGWVEFDIHITSPAWHRIILSAQPFPGRIDISINPSSAASSIHLRGGRPIGNGRFDMGAVWLNSEKYIVKLEYLNWTGFPAVSKLELEPASLAGTFPFRVIPPQERSFRTQTCGSFFLEAGGDRRAATLIITANHDSDLTNQTLSIAPADEAKRYELALRCEIPGDYTISVTEGGHPFAQEFRYSVFASDRAEPVLIKGRLVQEIDLAQVAPDYASSATAIVSQKAGSYRTSDKYGFTPYARSSADAQKHMSAPSWFAYKLSLPSPDRPYLLEVDYPDDAPRLFAVAIRERGASLFTYPPSIGAETGTNWPISNRFATMEQIFWPRTTDPRAVIMNVQDGASAAVSKLRVYEINDYDSYAEPNGGDRQFMIWNEEGENFSGLVGLEPRSHKVHKVVDRWLRSIRSAGANMVSPTAAIYDFAIYPSNYNLVFSDPDRDLLRAILLGAERYGLAVVPQLHPRGDELVWNALGAGKKETRLLLSKEGKPHFLTADRRNRIYPPHYNPIDPTVQEWYIGMIGELAERYKAFPAFKGVDLRLSSWQNPSFNNFVSLNWGYDRNTAELFYKDSGLPFPTELLGLEDEERFAKAMEAVVLSRHRDLWIDWRCHKIYELYIRIRDRVRAARPDLIVYTSLFAWGDTITTPDVSLLREAGVDPSLLGRIDGVKVINALYQYGQKEPSETWKRRNHDYIMEQSNFRPFQHGSSGPSIVMPMQYHEATGSVTPSPSLGLPTPLREPITSAATNPPGRLYLERFATVLGLTNAALLGDGGNGYVLGLPYLKEFLSRYLRLSRSDYQRVEEMPDVLAAWQSNDTVYVVNMMPYQLTASLRTKPEARLTPLDDKPDMDKSADKHSFLLAPFELKVFRTDVSKPVMNGDAELRSNDIASIQSAIEASKPSNNKFCNTALLLVTNAEICNGVAIATEQAKLSMAKGKYWNALRSLSSTLGSQLWSRER